MKLEISSDCEATITHTFAAPRRVVFDALTQPALVQRWYGAAPLTLTVCEADLRIGGTWRQVLRAPDGSEHGFTGVYRVLEPPARIVRTERYEALGPGHEILATLTLAEDDARTTLTIALAYPSRADRDGHLRSGMEGGMRASFERLADLLPALG